MDRLAQYEEQFEYFHSSNRTALKRQVVFIMYLFQFRQSFESFCRKTNTDERDQRRPVDDRGRWQRILIRSVDIWPISGQGILGITISKLVIEFQTIDLMAR